MHGPLISTPEGPPELGVQGDTVAPEDTPARVTHKLIMKSTGNQRFSSLPFLPHHACVGDSVSPVRSPD